MGSKEIQEIETSMDLGFNELNVDLSLFISKMGISALKASAVQASADIPRWPRSIEKAHLDILSVRSV